MFFFFFLACFFFGGTGWGRVAWVRSVAGRLAALGVVTLLLVHQCRGSANTAIIAPQLSFIIELSIREGCLEKTGTWTDICWLIYVNLRSKVTEISKSSYLVDGARKCHRELDSFE